MTYVNAAVHEERSQGPFPANVASLSGTLPTMTLTNG
jgi:hypothetical protein